MVLEQLNEHCFYFPGRVNIGYVCNGNEGMVIDSGIDDGAMKKVHKQLKKQGLPITFLFVTHAHADHYGGAAYLQQQTQVETIAPKLEEAVLQNPVLEPIYLFGGNDPLPELRNKFLEGKPITVDHVINEGTHAFGGLNFEAHLIPGHSYQQLGVEYESIFYAGDGYFGTDQLYLHKIPYLTDAKAAMESLGKIKQLKSTGALPGHGKFEKNYKDTVERNITYHQELLGWLENRIGMFEDGISHETIIADMLWEYGVETDQLSQWLLYRTAVTGYLTALLQEKKIRYQIEKGKWMFFPEKP